MSLTILLLVGLAALLLGSGLLYLSVRRQGWHRRVLPWVGVVGAAVPLVAVGLVGYVAVTEGLTLAGPDRPTAEELAAPAESFEYRLVGDDSEHSLEQHRGQVVLLNLWATWCAPCLAEMPDLSRLQEHYGEQGLVVIKLSNELGSALRSFAEREPLAAATAYVENPSRVPQPFRRGFRVLPTTYVLDRDGIIREFYVGGRSFEFHEGKVKPLL
jgi:cytochrome c biogenesis protein CcmG, thiol:disulfide interchange protein DsbE